MSGALVDTMAEGRIQKALSGFYYVDTGAESTFRLAWELSLIHI